MRVEKLFIKMIEDKISFMLGLTKLLKSGKLNYDETQGKMDIS